MKAEDREKATSAMRKALEGGNVQFIAENDERNELVGAGVRWRSKRGSLRIKVV